MSVDIEKLEARRKSKMAAARLEHVILMAIINHVAEEHLSRSQIVMALINVTSWWQNKIVLDEVNKEFNEQ